MVLEEQRQKTLKWLQSKYPGGPAEIPPGYMGDPGRCPVAQWLTEAGYRDVEVAAVTVIYRDFIVIAVGIPVVVANFIRAFDSGDYPDLVAPRDGEGTLVSPRV